MKLLFDENLSFRLCRQLSDVFPGSSQVRLAGLERADDMAVWAYAKANDFTIATLDADFLDLAQIFGSPPKVVWLRCGNPSTRTIEARLRNHAEAISQLIEGASTCLEIY